MRVTKGYKHASIYFYFGLNVFLTGLFFKRYYFTKPMFHLNFNGIKIFTNRCSVCYTHTVKIKYVLISVKSVFKSNLNQLSNQIDKFFRT